MFWTSYVAGFRAYVFFRVQFIPFEQTHILLLLFHAPSPMLHTITLTLTCYWCFSCHQPHCSQHPHIHRPAQRRILQKSKYSERSITETQQSIQPCPNYLAVPVVKRLPVRCCTVHTLQYHMYSLFRLCIKYLYVVVLLCFKFIVHCGPPRSRWIIDDIWNNNLWFVRINLRQMNTWIQFVSDFLLLSDRTPML